MARPANSAPTDGEMAILKALWKIGPATVRQVHDEIGSKPPVGYTTVLKLMQIMTEKGILLRDESARSHVYRPARPRQTTLRDMVGGMLRRAFDGSAAELVQGAIAAKPPSAEEIAEIRRILDEHERRRS